MAGPDLSTVTALVDFGSVVTAVAGVYAALVVVAVAWKGASMILDAVQGRRERNFDAQEWERENYIREQEEFYRAEWAKFDDEDKRWLGVTSYSDWRSRYTID